MGKGGVKYEAEILSEIELLLNQQNGIISQAQIIKIIQKYYSQLYAESSCFNKIERTIIRKNMVKSVKVNISNLPAQKLAKAHQVNQYLSIYLSPSIPDDKKKSLIATFIRNTIPSVEMPAMKRTLSKELFIEHSVQFRKRPETMEFPSIQFRAMLLHQFLLSTFKFNPFSIEMIANSIPVYLTAQIIRTYEIKPVILSIILPLEQTYQFEIDMLLPYLRLPFHSLIKRIDATYNSISPSAIIEIPPFHINKRYDFLNDPSAFSDYWLLIFTLGNEKFTQFPISIATRFEKFINIQCDKYPITEIPFFPYQIEKFSDKFGVAPSISSYTIQKIFKRKLRTLQCSKETFLESKLFPLKGFLPFIITKIAFLKSSDPKFADSLSTPFKVDGSLESLAKLYAASQLTEEGYIFSQRSNFKLFKKQVKKWVSQCTKFSNFFSSLKENEGFRSLIMHEMALLIEEMKFPSFYFERVNSNNENNQNNNENNQNNNENNQNNNENNQNNNENNQNNNENNQNNNENNQNNNENNQNNNENNQNNNENNQNNNENNQNNNENSMYDNKNKLNNDQDNLNENCLDNDQSDLNENSRLNGGGVTFDVNVNDCDGRSNLMRLMRSNSANFRAESFKQVDRILHSPSFHSIEKSSSKSNLTDLNSIFTKSFPHFTKEEMFSPEDVHSSIANNNNNNNEEEEENINEDMYFEDGDNNFPTAYSIDSPLNSDLSNDETVEPSIIASDDQDEDEDEDEDKIGGEFEEDDVFVVDEDDEKVEYPKLDRSDFIESCESDFLSLFELKKRIVDVEISVSVAIEFLKIILATPSSPSTNDLKLRQSVHFSQKDALDALWLLSSIDVYKREKIMKFPENEWELSIPEKSFPCPLFIPFCEVLRKDDLSPLKIVWTQTPVTENNEDDFDDFDNDEIVDDDINNDDFLYENKNRKRHDFITFHFKNVTFRQQISAFKKLKYTFNFERQRFDLPKLPVLKNLTTSKTASKSEKNLNQDQSQLNDQLYNFDPLGQFCFGQYDADVPYLDDFHSRFIVNLVNSAGVYGIELTDIIHSFGFPILKSEEIITRVLNLCTMDFICRVPSSRLVPRYSRFIPCNTICKPINSRIELVSPHIWTNFDGFINIDVKVNLMKNIATFIFAHEFCDFLSLIDEFSYVSPYDICLLLQMLECDEIIFSQYFQIIKPNLFEDEITIPIPPFEPFEKFLIVLDVQRKNNVDFYFRRILRTNRKMLPNLCILNDL